uniref:Ig-like domain-containing protein n=1 Tax=Poecilia mexicana TaxID=48701 RepID=A0A3B3WKQ5_9TELE
MTPLMFIGYVTCLILDTLAHSEAQTPSPSLNFESVNIGFSMTLKCFHKETDGVAFYWYKQTLVQKPQQMSEFYRHKRNGSLIGEFRNDPRFELETGKNKNHLRISNVQMSDSATYYCAGIDTYLYKFLEGITVHVKESNLNIWTLVDQSRSEIIQPGGSVTLKCTVQSGTCDGEHRVFWFRNSEEHLPEIIYTNGASDDQCKKPTTQAHSCVYSLTIESLNASSAGTYHCAVASCGHILFGKGMNLDYEKKSAPPVLLFALSGALVFTYIAIVQDNIWHKIYAVQDLTLLFIQDYGDAENLHYAALRSSKLSRSRGTRDATDEVVYSTVGPQN